MAEKFGLRVPTETTIPMEIGNELEPWLRSKYLLNHPSATDLRINEFGTNDLFHLAGTADLIYEEDGIKKGAEFKTTSETWTEVPFRVKVQTHVYMLVFGMTTWDVLSLHASRSLSDFFVEFDPQLANQIIETARHYKEVFWDTQTLPEEGPAPAPAMDNSTLVITSNEAKEKAASYMMNKQERDRIEEYLETIKSEFITQLGTNKKAKAGNYVISSGWVSGRKKTDWEGMVRWFQHKYPGDYSALEAANTTYGEPYRNFSVKEGS